MDNFHFYLRMMAGAFAILGALGLLWFLASGRSSFAGRKVRRDEDAKGYWLGLTRLAFLVAGMALAATIVPDRLFAPIIFLFMLVPALAQALLTGRFDWEADDQRIDSPRRFWRWVAFYVILCLMMGAIVLIELAGL